MPADRRSILLEGIGKTDLGLEFGPSFSPAAPKREGYNVEIIDHLSQEGLIAHYRSHGVDLSAIETVDYVWEGGSYAELTGKKAYYDYIIAGQVLEHTTNFVAFLRDCSCMLKGEGVLSLSLPDKRLCFDTFRQITPLGKILNDYYFPQSYHSAGSCVEYYLNTVCVGEREIAWAAFKKDAQYHFTTGFDTVRRAEKEVLETHSFHDIHEYVFTPASFELLIYDLNLLGHLDLIIEGPIQFFGHEFFAKLKKSGQPLEYCPAHRLELLERIQAELSCQRVQACKEQADREIEAKDRQISGLFAQNTQLSGQVSALRAQAGGLAGENQRLEEQLAHLKKELSQRMEAYQRLAQENNQYEKENKRLVKEKAEILASTCWRMTRPLRAVMDRLRGR